MNARADELARLTESFLDAFNRRAADEVMGYFADDCVFEDPRGGRFEGKAEIRKAFTPRFNGEKGEYRFEGTDFFVSTCGQKVLAGWILHTKSDDTWESRKGVDILHFQGDKLTAKLAYAKA